MAHPSEMARAVLLARSLPRPTQIEPASFMGEMFGWTSDDQLIEWRRCSRRLLLSSTDVGSLYQMKREHIDQGARSHWTLCSRPRCEQRGGAGPLLAGGTLLVRALYCVWRRHHRA